MKKYFLLIAAGPAALMASAQTPYQDGSRELAATAARSQVSAPLCKSCNTSGAAPSVRVISYSINGHGAYYVSGAVPRSDVELYSAPSGGRMVAQKTADDQGGATFNLDGTPPAFALNHNRRNANGVSGNAQLSTIRGRDLVLNNLRVVAEGKQVRISWNAAAMPGSWTFVVQRSRDNQTFEDVETVTPKGSALLNNYAVSTSPVEIPVSYYRVEARYKDGFSVAMPAEAFKQAVPAFFQAVPTVFTGSVQLVISPDRLPARYTVTDMTGHNQLYAGVLSSPKQLVSLKLNAGFYLVAVTDKKGASSSQVIIKN